MPTYEILKDSDGGTAVLTTNSPCSHYCIPVLQITAPDIDGDFGPASLIDFTPLGGGLRRAANIVHVWASDPARSDEERRAAQSFLRQWPAGPQI